MKIDDLNPCPFCGSEDLRKVQLPKISKDLTEFTMILSHVECLICGCDGPKMDYVDDVLRAWNKD